ncbi:MAG: hypothetical protein D6832_02860 [Alphaproteobacteria bacterium]|nr:MAG: hypothetical protein D6832_02860 [Alphaproteobacteria bacterium]
MFMLERPAAGRIEAVVGAEGLSVAPGSPLGRPGRPLRAALRFALHAAGRPPVRCELLAGPGVMGLEPLLATDRPLEPGVEYTLLELAPCTGPEPARLLPLPRSGVHRGTRIRLAEGGSRPVEELRPGDLVATAGGAQPVLWLAPRLLPAIGSAAPVTVAAGALGSAADLVLGPDAAVSPAPEAPVLLRISALAQGGPIARRSGGRAEYWDVLLPRHDLLLAEGLAVASFLADATGLAALPEAERAALLAACRTARIDPPARPCRPVLDGAAALRRPAG